MTIQNDVANDPYVERQRVDLDAASVWASFAWSLKFGFASFVRRLNLDTSRGSA